MKIDAMIVDGTYSMQYVHFARVCFSLGIYYVCLCVHCSVWDKQVMSQLYYFFLLANVSC